MGARKFLYFQKSGLGGRKNSGGLFLETSVLVLVLYSTGVGKEGYSWDRINIPRFQSLY